MTLALIPVLILSVLSLGPFRRAALFNELLYRVLLSCSHFITHTLRLGNRLESQDCLLKGNTDVFHEVNQLWMQFIVQHIFVQLLVLFHLEVLHALQLTLASN